MAPAPRTVPVVDRWLTPCGIPRESASCLLRSTGIITDLVPSFLLLCLLFYEWRALHCCSSGECYCLTSSIICCGLYCPCSECHVYAAVSAWPSALSAVRTSVVDGKSDAIKAIAHLYGTSSSNGSSALRLPYPEAPSSMVFLRLPYPEAPSSMVCCD